MQHEHDHQRSLICNGRYEVWTDCEGNGGALVKIGLTRFDQPGTIGVFIQLADARDLNALTHILQTLAID